MTGNSIKRKDSRIRILNWQTLAALAVCCLVPACAHDARNSGVVDDHLSGQPLSADELASLKNRLNIVHCGEYCADLIAKQYAHRLIAPDLIGIIQNNKESLNIRSAAIWVLGKTGDTAGAPVLMALIEQPLPDIVPREQSSLLSDALCCLGMFGDDESLRFLEKEACTEAYWLERNPQATTPNGKPENYRRHMRLVALNGLALSGSQRAIDMFDSGNGVPEDMLPECEWLLKAARMRNLGYIRVADYEARAK